MTPLATFTNSSDGALTVDVSCVIPATATYCTIIAGMRGGDGGATTLSSATLGAQAFTLNSTLMRVFQTFQATEGGYILAADLPSGTLTATATRATATNGFTISVSFFDDVIQQAPVVQLASNGAGGDPFDTSITVSDTAVLVDGIHTATSSATFTTNQTGQSQVSTITSSNISSFSAVRSVSSGANTMGWDTSGNTNRTTHLILGLETAGGPTDAITDIDTDEILEDGQTDAAFTHTGFASPINAGNLIVTGPGGPFTVALTNVTDSDFDLVSLTDQITGVVAFASAPFDTASYSSVIELTDGTVTEELAITRNPPTGWEVVELTSHLDELGNVLYQFTGTLTDAVQVIHPDTISVAADGKWTSNLPVDSVVTLGVFDKSTGQTRSSGLLITGLTDTTPDVFSFTAATGVELSTVTESNIVTITGIDSTAAISVIGGEYRINGGSYTSTASTVSNNDTVQVRGTSSGSYVTEVDVSLIVGTGNGTFTITTRVAPDTVPDVFSFTAQTDVELSTAVISNTITVAGMDAPAALTLDVGEYSINGGAYTTGAINVTNGDTVTLRTTSSASYSTVVTANLVIGGVGAAFSITTRAIVNPVMAATASRNVAVGTTNAGSYVASAGDSPITYTITGANAGLFSVNSSTGALVYLVAPLVGDIGTQHTVNVVATNAGDSDTTVVTTTIVAANTGSHVVNKLSISLSLGL